MACRTLLCPLPRLLSSMHRCHLPFALAGEIAVVLPVIFRCLLVCLSGLDRAVPSANCLVSSEGMHILSSLQQQRLSATVADTPPPPTH
jgi:hypothetical protein